MLTAWVKFGQRHIVTHLGDRFKGVQELALACHPHGLILSEANKHRWKLTEGTSESIGCLHCLEAAGLVEDREPPEES